MRQEATTEGDEWRKRQGTNLREEDGGEDVGRVKHEEQARLLHEWQRDRRGKRKRIWYGREAK